MGWNLAQKERKLDFQIIRNIVILIKKELKRKWTVAFTKWCNDQYDKYGSQYGLFCCSFMRICDLCEMKKCNGCADCVETIKEWFKKQGKEIPYRNYNFEEILKEIEE